jgi:hypothetical protein
MRKQIAPIVLMALLGQIEATRLHSRRSAMLAQQDTITEEQSGEVPKTEALSSLESLIPFPPTVEEEAPASEALHSALEGFGGSHSVNVGPTEAEAVVEEEPVPVDINDIDIAALGESLGLDPSSNAFRR